MGGSGWVGTDLYAGILGYWGLLDHNDWDNGFTIEIGAFIVNAVRYWFRFWRLLVSFRVFWGQSYRL